MKIAFDGTVLHGRKSGVGYYCEELLKAMLAANHEDQFFVFSHQRLETKQTTPGDRKSTRLNSSHQIISYAVFCLKKKKISCQQLLSTIRMTIIPTAMNALE